MNARLAYAMSHLNLSVLHLSVALGILCGTPAFAFDENSQDKAAPLSSEAVEFFEKKVRPILVDNCYDCHSGEEQNGGLLMDSGPALLKGGDSGPAAVPGDPDASLFITAIRYEDRDMQMPPQNRLSDEDIAILEAWVKMGLPDPREETSTGNAPTGMTIEEGRRFWSFVPVTESTIPNVSHTDWGKTPIDAFLLSAMEAKELQPADDADKRSLIRRITFNLTGLPPTIDEITAFLADDSADAYEKLVERLLASPQYGVRWGRHWLDVARYADSNGLDENLAFGNAWRYRDYVVDAFNNDKPFDRFLIEQIAGDLIPESDRESIIATGFLSLGAKVLAEPDREKLAMDTVDEQLDTTGKAFMGMTLGCVRCHDHKFDPIKQTDYYALAAIFKSTRTFDSTSTGAIKHWNEHSFSTPEEKEALKDVEAEIKKCKSAASSYRSKALAKIRSDAESNAANYLMAATDISVMSNLVEIEAVAAKHALHPRILHHCRKHLSYHRYDPFFEAWHKLQEQGPEAVEQHYRPLFAAVTAIDAAKKTDGKDAKPATAPTDYSPKQLNIARAALKDASGFLAVPPKVEYAFDAETLKEYNRLEEESRLTESAAPDPAAAMCVGEETTLASLPIHIRGSHLNLGEPVDREFPEVMRTSSVRPVLPEKQSGRLELANWMASPQHPLTARVFVNRVWNWHFGRGLVGSTENFGRLGDRPTHPELLDWLAYKFMESGWKVKELHRLILNSRVYQMSAVHNDEGAGIAADPENHLLWKFPIRRLSAEQIRDSLLAVSGRLDVSLGGKTVPLRNRQFVFNHTSVDHTKYDSLRRAVYLPVIRNNVYPLFVQFDFPDPTMPTGHRNETVIAPQALLMMNSGLVMDSATALAKQLVTTGPDDSHRVATAYEQTIGRLPTEEEMSRSTKFIADVSSAVGPTEGDQQSASVRAWALFCQSLFAGNEFMYIR